jgi:hypothetical protein
MKKFILSAIAAGALAAGSAASAQDLGTVLGTILGAGQQQHPAGSVYIDPYGRQVAVDQWGRHVLVQPNTGSHAITGYDAWGRPIYERQTLADRLRSINRYGESQRYADSDGDGVANAQDRWPADPRHW